LGKKGKKFKHTRKGHCEEEVARKAKWEGENTDGQKGGKGPTDRFRTSLVAEGDLESGGGGKKKKKRPECIGGANSGASFESENFAYRPMQKRKIGFTGEYL